MTDTPEAVRLADELAQLAAEGSAIIHLQSGAYICQKFAEAAALLRRFPELEAERDKLAIQLNDLTALNEYVKERRAQISHRLWVWAHEELSEPLKTRYFNIVANGTADVMEQPTYAQQFNAMKYRAESSEAERDQLRAELEKVRVPEGWKLVPEQMTDAMRDAGNEWICNRYLLQGAWHSAVSAAPTPPHADQKGQ